MARTISDAALAAWLVGNVANLPQKQTAPASRWEPPPPELPEINLPEGDSPTPALPLIEEAANALAARRVMTAEEFHREAGRAAQVGFTVATIATEDALERIQAAIVKDVRGGGTLESFTVDVDRILGKSALSPHHVENVYRSTVMGSYSDGQKRILAHPLVASEFPYVEYYATADGRAESSHKAMERHGIQGTNVYRVDDPVIQKFWPPWRWQCRCHVVAISLERAAARGIEEAIRWLATGQPPAFPAHVPAPPFDLPPGWVKS